jgi:hypothetical protein
MVFRRLGALAGSLDHPRLDSRYPLFASAMTSEHVSTTPLSKRHGWVRLTLPMPKFKVGDHVERIGALVPEYMRSGVIVRVIPNKGLDWFAEYEINFSEMLIATFYETQLRLVETAKDSH